LVERTLKGDYPTAGNATDTAASEAVNEAHRQIQICNACRYCEGYCAVFPAINRQRSFVDGDIIQLANLCHNCRGCYYACQYAEPHEFDVNLPRALAHVRASNWQTFIYPQAFARAFQQRGVLLALMLVVCLALMFIAATSLRSASGGSGFYAVLSHSVMVTIFAPAFLLPLIITAFGLRAYWRAIGGQRVGVSHLLGALRPAATLDNLSGGQGQGCNFEREERFTNTRRWLHQACMYGFLLCFASTVSGTILHYVFASPAPYPLFSVPKLLGVHGGLLLTVGCIGLAWLKTKADASLGAASLWGAEMAFIVLLGATGATGLLLYAATGTALVAPLLAIHLGCVLAFFLTTPYTKMVHGFFRMAALVRDAQIKLDTQ
jgi:citrate/tricarballylate utilization protein